LSDITGGKQAVCLTRYKRGCNQQVFVYQGAGGRLQMPPMMFLWLSGARRRNLSMFRSNGFNFYHGPIHPDWPDIHTTISKQRQIRDECIDADELYCLGTSMGGYAAMLFGHYLKADIVHAFGAQTHIDMKSAKVADKDVPESHRDLAILLRQWNGRTRYMMYYNEGYEPDRLAAERMAGIEGVELVPLPGNTHNVFKENGRLKMLSDLFPPERESK
jgi:hypothetical protein